MNTEKVRLVTDEAQLEEFRKAQARGDVRRAYWDANFVRLREQYPDEFVAVLDDQVIVHSPNFWYLVGFLEGRGIEPGDTYIEHLASVQRRMIL